MSARRLLIVMVPFALVSFVTLAGGAFVSLLGTAGQMLLYLSVAIGCAFYRGYAEAVLAAVLSVLAFNYFFLPPLHTFHIADDQSWMALVGLLLVTLTIARLASNFREQRDHAEKRAERARQALQLTENLALRSSVEDIGSTGLRALHDAFHSPAALVLGQAHDMTIVARFPPAAEAFDLNAARWCISNQRALGPGTPDWPGIPCWCVPLVSVEGTFGAIQLVLDPAHLPTRLPEDLEHLQLLSRQVGLALQRERAQQASRDAQRAAEVESVRNTLLASISHDMRAPLAVIVGAASTLHEQQESLPANDREKLLKGIVDEGLRMTRTMENVLSLARLSVGAGDTLRTDWESVEEIVGVVAAAFRRRAPGQSFSVAVSADLPLLRVDSQLLAQALDNLLDNAFRHGAGGSIELLASGDDQHVDLVVRDHGPGLPAGIDPAQLFQPFVRGSKTFSTSGHGLGLAICRQIALLHGGSLTVRNHPQGGAVFCLSLPVVRFDRQENPA